MVRATPGLMVLAPGGRQRSGRGVEGRHAAPARACAAGLTRQALPQSTDEIAPAAGLARGAYVLADATGGKPDVLLLATGSEVYLCVDAFERLSKEGIQARVVSMRLELFEKQDQAYRNSVLHRGEGPRLRRDGHNIRMVALTWARRPQHRMHSFGASAPLKDFKTFGFT